MGGRDRRVRPPMAFGIASGRIVPAVAGDDVTKGAVEACLQHNVFLVQDGQYLYWNEALSYALAG